MNIQKTHIALEDPHSGDGVGGLPMAVRNLQALCFWAMRPGRLREMLQESICDVVVGATVSFPKIGGQGVLVNGELILTAAHCIDFTCAGDMVLGDYFVEEVKTNKGIVKVAPLAVEPVSDIAVCGALDDQEFHREVEDFEDFCEQTRPVPVFRGEMQFPKYRSGELPKLSELSALRKAFNVYIYTHRQTWVTGKARQMWPGAKSLWVEADEQIESGTSGGPVINDSGELVGIVSHSGGIPSGETEGRQGQVPRPHLALPVWICRRIFNSHTIGIDQ